MDDPPNETPTNKGFLDDYPVDQQSCALLGSTALIVQLLMGIFVILSLVYKRHREESKRPWRIWLFDVSKQVCGQLFVHGVNVLVSDVISQFTSGNACTFYFLNVLLDTTLGVALLYLILNLMQQMLTEKLGLKGFESGVYGTPPSFTFWGRQTAIYVLALTTMKFIVLLLLILFPGILKLGEWLLSWTYMGEGDAFQVIFVMGIFPIVMNVIQFWLIDSIVKASGSPAVVLGERADPFDQSDREPLFQANSDDEDDENHPYDIENPRPAPEVSRSRSPPPQPSGSSPESLVESKSVASGSSDPQEAMEMHSYPPSLSNSMNSTSTFSSTATTNSKSTPKLKPASKLDSSGNRSVSPQRHGSKSLKAKPKTRLGGKPTTPTTTTEWDDNWGDDNWSNNVERDEKDSWTHESPRVELAS